jgi:hypothetical protein
MVRDFHREAKNSSCLPLSDVGPCHGMSLFHLIVRLLYICKDLPSEAVHFVRLMACSRASLAGEVLFLRKQLAFYQERKIKPRRFDDAARSMLLLSKFFDWKNALINVKPDTFIGWHKKAFLAVLVLEVTRWKVTAAQRNSAIDCRDGRQQSNAGTRARGRRIIAQAGNPSVAAHGEKVLAGGREFRPKKGLGTTLVDVCAQPRKFACCLRFCHGRNRAVPQTLRAGSDGNRHAEDPPLQCHRTSHGRVDCTAVPRSHSKRSLLSVPDP